MTQHKKEEWRDIEGYPGYHVSSLGRVLGISGKILRQSPGGNQYLCVSLCKNKKASTKKVHHLVAAAFIGRRPHGLDCCHLSGIKTDNTPTNLEYVTRKENMSHTILHGTKAMGERCGKAKLTEKEARYIIENYKLRDRSLGARPLSKRFGVSRVTITEIVRGKTWKHIHEAQQIQTPGR